MQIFIKKVATLQVDLMDSVYHVKEEINLVNGVPVDQQRLIYVGKELQDDRLLSEYDVLKDSTLHLTYRMRGGVAAKRKCTFGTCTAMRAPIVGECAFCDVKFCAKHRLLEDHRCAGLSNCKKESHDRNKALLESQQCVASRV